MRVITLNSWTLLGFENLIKSDKSNYSYQCQTAMTITSIDQIKKTQFQKKNQKYIKLLLFFVYAQQVIYRNNLFKPKCIEILCLCIFLCVTKTTNKKNRDECCAQKWKPTTAWVVVHNFRRRFCQQTYYVLFIKKKYV